jgi:hypothetical protein
MGKARWILKNGVSISKRLKEKEARNAALLKKVASPKKEVIRSPKKVVAVSPKEVVSPPKKPKVWTAKAKRDLQVGRFKCSV